MLCYLDISYNPIGGHALPGRGLGLGIRHARSAQR